MNKGTKIGIVGAGRVGSTLAYTLAASGTVRDIVLIDADWLRAEGEAMDIAHAVAFSSPVTIKAGEVTEVAGAAICRDRRWRRTTSWRKQTSAAATKCGGAAGHDKRGRTRKSRMLCITIA